MFQSHVSKEQVTSKSHHKITTCHLLLRNVQGKLLVLLPCFCDPNVCMCQLFIFVLNRHVQFSPTPPCFLCCTSRDVNSWGRRPHVPAPLCSCMCLDVKGPQCPWQSPGRAIVRFHVVQMCFLLKQTKSSGWCCAAFLMVVSHNAAQSSCRVGALDVLFPGQARLLISAAACHWLLPKCSASNLF